MLDLHKVKALEKKNKQIQNKMLPILSNAIDKCSFRTALVLMNQVIAAQYNKMTHTAVREMGGFGSALL